MRVLLVEEDPPSAELIINRLNLLSCQVVLAEDASEGLRFAESEHPDIIIANIVFGGSVESGIQMLRQLRQNPVTAQTPILLHTSHVGATEALTLVDASLTKPCHLHELSRTIEEVLGGSHRAQA